VAIHGDTISANPLTIIDSRRSERLFNPEKNPANPANAPTSGNAKDSCANGQIEAIGPSALVNRICALHTIIYVQYYADPTAAKRAAPASGKAAFAGFADPGSIAGADSPFPLRIEH
jgi:hypothetical protein